MFGVAWCVVVLRVLCVCCAGVDVVWGLVLKVVFAVLCVLCVLMCECCSCCLVCCAGVVVVVFALCWYVVGVVL